MGDIQYIKNSMKQYGKLKGKKVTINNYGEENYSCLVIEKIKPYMKIKKKVKIYSCYKFNPSHTKYKKVTTILTYTKVPTLPTKYKSLANEYTYQDLQRRAKRILDSLYIKDGW